MRSNRIAALTVLLVSVGVWQNSLAQGHTITEFDPPGSISTVPYSINSGGTITGYYQDAKLIYHGFLRDSAGNITSFDMPGAANGKYLGTMAFSINDSGQIIGWYNPSSLPNTYQGFVRDALGNYTNVLIPGSVFTQPFAINSTGQIVGCAAARICNDFNTTDFGFIQDSSGTLVEFRAAGSINTASLSINGGGSVTGFYNDSKNAVHSFVRATNGKITEFDAPGGYRGGGFLGTRAWGINDVGVIVGFYNDSSPRSRGFIRDPKGNITPFDAPGTGTVNTYTLAINALGMVTGYFTDSGSLGGSYQGFVGNGAGKTQAFNVPGASQRGGHGTFGLSINASGQVAGYFVDDNGVGHGFLRQ